MPSPAFATQLEQAAAHGAGVRHAQISAVLFHQYGQAKKISVNAGRPGTHVGLHARNLGP